MDDKDLKVGDQYIFKVVNGDQEKHRRRYPFSINCSSSFGEHFPLWDKLNNHLVEIVEIRGNKLPAQLRIRVISNSEGDHQYSECWVDARTGYGSNLGDFFHPVMKKTTGCCCNSRSLWIKGCDCGAFTAETR